MTDFVFPSDNDRAASPELDRVCNYLAYTLDNLDALRATNSDLRALYESTRLQLGKARARVAELEEVAKESQDWDWLSAKAHAEEREQEFFEIPKMQELWESARNGDGKAYVLRKQAEALEAMAEKIRNDARGANTLWEMLIVMDVEAQELRKKAEAIERAVDEGAEMASEEVARLKAKLEALMALQAPVILRKQAEAVEQCWTDIAEMAFSTEVRTPEGAFTKAAGYCADYSLRLRKQAEAAERAREDGGNG